MTSGADRTGALLLRPHARGQSSGQGASRSSALRSDLVRGTQVLHADLHNHSDLSDAAGSADDAFACMRAAGLDAAALTDHAGLRDESALERLRELVPWAGMPSKVIDDADFVRAGELADAFDDPGAFTAVRGFEWTTPHLGHVNVWFSTAWTQVVDTDGMAGLHDWLAGPAPGPDSIFGLNHPGREIYRFDDFRHDPRLTDRLVSMEMFNRVDDYLFEGYGSGAVSPLVQCLAAGWRPGLLGVSDEHGIRWGFEPERGRAGLWVREWSRAGLREALRARRFYATREPGLRLDVVASVGAEETRLGGELAVPAGTRQVELAVDVDGGPSWSGRAVEVQVLTTGITAPTVLAVQQARSGEVATVVVDLQGEWEADEAPWLVVRVADPTAHNLQPGPSGHPCNNRALAYASPVRLVRAGRTPSG